MTVTLLGGVRVEAGGSTVDVAALGRQAVVVLGRLALAGSTGVSRTELREALWGDVPPSTWRSALRNVVANLRGSLDRSGIAPSLSIVTTAVGYATAAPRGLEVDVQSLLTLADQAHKAWLAADHELVTRCGDGVRAWAGQDALPGVVGDWVETVRARVFQAQLFAEDLAARAALAAGDSAGAERSARRLVAAAPLREDAYRLLMEALRQSGNRAQAIAEYYACRRVLAERLGALPDAETERIYLAILAEERRQETGLPGAPPSGSLAGERDVAPAGERDVPLAGERDVAPAGERDVAPAGERDVAPAGERDVAPNGPWVGATPIFVSPTPFVGRREILEDLSLRLAMVDSGGALVVAIGGEPGIGKTRLAAELAHLARRRGMAVLYGRTDGSVSVPFGSWLHAIDQGLAVAARWTREDLAPYLAVLSALAPTAPGGQPVERIRPGREQVVRSVVACLGRLVAPRGGLVVIDDAEWASAGDIDVVKAVLADPRATPALVVVLHRNRADDAALGSLDGDPRITRLELGPLDAAAVVDLVRHEDPGKSDEELDAQAAVLHRRSGGNPLLAWALLGASSGGLEATGHAKLNELVGARLAALPPACRDLLAVAAVAGTEIDVALVAAATGSDVPTVIDVLRPAYDTGLLVAGSDDQGSLAFRHGVVRERLLDELRPPERLRAHHLLGAALESKATGELAPVAEIAYHLAGGGADAGAVGGGGDWRRSLRYGLTAAQVAFDAGVFEDVVALSTRTLAVLDAAGDPDPGSRIDLQVLLGGALRALGRQHGDDLLRVSFEAACAAGDGARMADAVLAFAGVEASSDQLAMDEQLLELCQRAADALGPSDLRRRSLLLARISGGQAWRGGLAAAAAAATEALELAHRLGDPMTTAEVIASVRRSLATAGTPQQQTQLEEELAALAVELDDPRLSLSAALWRVDTDVLRGHGESLEDLLKAAARDARSVTSGGFHHLLAVAQAAVAVLRDELDVADVLVERAARVGIRHAVDPVIVEAVRLAQLTVLRTEQGRLDELRDDVVRFSGATGIPTWLGVLGYVDAALDDMSDVDQRVDALVDAFAASGPSGVCPPGLLAYMSAPVVKLADPARVERVLRLLEPFAGQGAVIACFAGPVDHHLGVLAHALGRREEAERRFAAAHDFSARLGAPRWQARATQALQGIR